MSNPELVLYDDATAQRWLPFTLTRPAGELMLGAFTLRARAERVLGMRCAGCLTADHLRGFDEPDAAPVLDAATLSPGRPRLYLNARALLDWKTVWRAPDRAAVLQLDGEVVGYWQPDGSVPAPLTGNAERAAPDVATVTVHGRVPCRVWELVNASPEQIEHDIAAAAPAPRPLPPHVAVIGDPSNVRIGRDVTIEPGVVLDAESGPIWLDDGVRVRAFTRLAGPAYVGPGSILLGGSLSRVTIGPQSRIHGEVEETVILGYTNKAHDGFIGHAYLGRWVNLGALTTNSDLKNNYSTIRIWTQEGDVNTGQIKVGCFLGDHVKTGIGVMLNTGTVVGAGSNLFGATQPPKYVPPFTWGTGSHLGLYELDRFLAAAETVMQRRNVTMTPGIRAVLRAAWVKEHGEEGT